MPSEYADIVHAAIRGWPETLRLCAIIVVAAIMIVCIYILKMPEVHIFMK